MGKWIRGRGEGGATRARKMISTYISCSKMTMYSRERGGRGDESMENDVYIM